MSGPSPPKGDDSLPAQLGEVIGGYRLDAVIGTGGMGCVYGGTHARLGRRAAIKVLRKSYAADTDYVARFFDEARVVNAMRHPNIIDIFDFIETEQPLRVACIMELLDGVTLRQRMGKKRLNPSETVNIAAQLASAIEAVQKIGVVHRDLKPDNVFLLADSGSEYAKIPSLKVLDFGIAKVQVTGAERTTPGLVLGTPAYMSPEQVSGQAVSAAADVYALGCVFYEMLSGKRLFIGEPMQIFRQKLVGAPPPLDLPDDLPAFDTIRMTIDRAIAFDAKRRPSVEEMKALIEGIRDEIHRSQLVRVAPARGGARSGPPRGPSTEPLVPLSPLIGPDEETRALATPMPAPVGADTLATFQAQLADDRAPSLKSRQLLAGVAAFFGTALIVGAWFLFGRSKAVVVESVPSSAAPIIAPVIKPPPPPAPPLRSPDPVIAKPEPVAPPPPPPPVVSDKPKKEPKAKPKKAALKKDDMAPW